MASTADTIQRLRDQINAADRHARSGISIADPHGTAFNNSMVSTMSDIVQYLENIPGYLHDAIDHAQRRKSARK